MLQEITEDDLQHIPSGMSKKNLLIVYNELKKHQKELDLEGYYFDDNFYWKTGFFPNKYKEEMIDGSNKFHIITDVNISPKQEKWKNFIQNMRSIYGRDCSWVKSNYQMQRYIAVLLNKFSFTDEFYFSLIEAKKKNDEIKMEEEKKIIKNESKKDNIKENAYIYGIIVDEELVYIGKTYRSLKERISEHIDCVLNENIQNSQQNYLYKAMRECKGYKFKIIYESHGEVNNRGLETIEKSMIELCKPKFNYEGVKVPYKYSDEK